MHRIGVDRVRDSNRGGEIGILEIEGQRPEVAGPVRIRQFDRRSIGNAAGRGNALRKALGLPDGRDAGHGDGALRHGVDLAIGTRQGRHDERAAEERHRVPHRRHRDVDALAAVHEGRQVRRHEHRRDVTRPQADVSDVDAEPIEHRLDRLFGERRVAQRVACPLQPDDEAIADQLIVADPFDLRDILDANRGRNGPQLADHENEDKKATHQLAPMRMLPSGRITPLTVMPLSILRTVTTSPAAPACSADA